LDSPGFTFWLAVTALVLCVAAALELFIGNRSVGALRDMPPAPDATAEKVSIIVAARNEERNIRTALQSLLELRYPDFELIAVDDRSEDYTGRILDDMAVSSPLLSIIHIDTLPDGWLGKNYALWTGSRAATGDYLLFTDADIVMEPTVVNRAMAYMKQHRLDHLAATPSMNMPTVFLGMFGASFIIAFSLFSRPWKAKDSSSPCHIGIGAFNLVRADAYRQVGGHETIRLRPDDDLKLGKILKKGGFRQDAAYAPEFLAVEWYESVSGAVKGLEKNAFSGADYNIPLVLCGAVFHTLCSIWPFAAIFLTGGVTQYLYVAVVIINILVFVDCARFHYVKAWYAVGYPISAALFVLILLRTMVLNLIQGGIYWRGTFYQLNELKKNKV
jgi:glycosyltransferase involved in cell wall biosynthesis